MDHKPRPCLFDFHQRATKKSSEPHGRSQANQPGSTLSGGVFFSARANGYRRCRHVKRCGAALQSRKVCGRFVEGFFANRQGIKTTTHLNFQTSLVQLLTRESGDLVSMALAKSGHGRCISGDPILQGSEGDSRSAALVPLARSFPAGRQNFGAPCLVACLNEASGSLGDSLQARRRRGEEPRNKNQGLTSRVPGRRSFFWEVVCLECPSDLKEWGQ